MVNGIDGIGAGGMDINQLTQMKQIEEMKKKILTQILTKEAHERLSMVRSVNPALANQADLYLLQIYQAGKITEPINDDQMKEVLKALSEKKDFNITRK